MLDAVQLVGDGAQAANNPHGVGIEEVVGFIEHRLDFLDVAHEPALFLEFLLLTCNEAGIVEFILLEPQEVLIVAAGLQLLLQRQQLVGNTLVGLVGSAVFVALTLIASYQINHIELEVLLAQEQVLMLAVDVDKAFAQVLHLLEGDRAVVDEGTALAIGSHLTAHDAILLIVVEVMFFKESLEMIFV